MKIVFTGGGTGGHFYPIIAVVQALHDIVEEEAYLSPDLYFMAPDPYDKGVLYDNEIDFIPIPAGKMRRYFSIKNISGLFKTSWGFFRALWKLYKIYPDVIFSKGGYGSVPVVLAAHFLKIPIMVHESDTVPGRANKLAGKYAERVAVAFAEAAKFFPQDNAASAGYPIREELRRAAPSGAFEFLELNPEIPTILVLGGSQGAEKINDVILDALPKLLEKYQVIHQTGNDHLDTVKRVANLVLKDSQHQDRYRPFGFLNALGMRMSAGAANLIISRAGSTIFEIAQWKKPSIIIPIASSNGNHQVKNAYAYARAGAAKVIEEKNLSDDIIISQVDNILGDDEMAMNMSKSAEKFATPEAARKIAQELLFLAEHHR